MYCGKKLWFLSCAELHIGSDRHLLHYFALQSFNYSMAKYNISGVPDPDRKSSLAEGKIAVLELMMVA